MNKQATFNEKVVWISFITSIFVIYIHANNLHNVGMNEDENMLGYVLSAVLGNDGIGGIAVPFFFLLSGYRFFCFNVFSLKSIQIIKQKMRRRIKSLVIPYVLWNSIGMLFYILVTRVPFALSIMNEPYIVEVSIPAILKGVFLYDYYFPFWFLHDLIILTLCTPFLVRVLRNKMCNIVLLLVVAMVYVLAPENIHFWEVYIFKAQSLLFFWLGASLSVYGRKNFERPYTKGKSLVSCILLFLLMMIRGTSIPMVSKLSLIIEPLLYWRAFDFMRIPRLKWFHRQSFFIYASHLIPTIIIMKLLAKLSYGNVWAAAIAYIITPGIVLYIIFILSKSLCHFMPHVYNILSGGRLSIPSDSEPSFRKSLPRKNIHPLQ